MLRRTPYSSRKPVNLTFEQINGLREETPISATNIWDLFHKESNPGEGNCLYHAFAEAMYGDINEQPKIRKRNYEYYQRFDMEKTYPADSIEEKIHLNIIGDTMDDDGEVHSLAIEHDYVYANITDAMICAKMHDVNVLMFCKNGKKHYVLPILIPNALNTIHIYYNGDNHFEALLPKTHYDSRLIDSHLYDKKKKMGYTVLDYDTDKKSETRYLFHVKYDNGENGTKTEYELCHNTLV